MKQIVLLGIFTGIYGVLVAGLNVWLLAQRITGRPVTDDGRLYD